MHTLAGVCMRVCAYPLSGRGAPLLTQSRVSIDLSITDAVSSLVLLFLSFCFDPSPSHLPNDPSNTTWHLIHPSPQYLSSEAFRPPHG